MRSICHVSLSTTWYITSLIIPVRSLLEDGAQKQDVGQGKGWGRHGWVEISIDLPYIIVNLRLQHRAFSQYINLITYYLIGSEIKL